MNASVLTQVFQTPDGKSFPTKELALEHLRKPAILTALSALTVGNVELSNWLLDNKTEIAETFDAGKIRRVTKQERAALEKAVKAVVDLGNPSFAFINDNHEAIIDSFRWPSVKREDESEQAATVKASFMALTENNEELVDWILSKKPELLSAFDAGKIKREVSAKATDALAEYRAKQAAIKEARKAAEAEGPEALAAFEQKLADEKAAELKAKAEAAKAARESRKVEDQA